jgi:AcrR family transcriptional regulator
MTEPGIPEEIGPDEEILGGPEGANRITELVARELGDDAARTFNEVWQRSYEWDERNYPGEGLRERKKRLTRQRISDIGTALFLSRGFDNVRVSEIAEKVGVSEKTIYNYFPTKESLVYDQADEQLVRLTSAVRDRPAGVTPTSAFVSSLKFETMRFSEAMGDSRLAFLPKFAEMVSETPSLRAAWGEIRYRMVEALAEVLADDYGVDPRDPEPMVTSRALVSLLELLYDSQLRRITSVDSGVQLQAAIEEDLARGARLLDTGLWSLHLMTVSGRINKEQLREAAATAEQARQQVMRAMREARRVWRELRDEARTAGREATRQSAREMHRERHNAVRGHHAAAHRRQPPTA